MSKNGFLKQVIPISIFIVVQIQKQLRICEDFLSCKARRTTQRLGKKTAKAG
jgi:hypothetical protein